MNLTSRWIALGSLAVVGLFGACGDDDDDERPPTDGVPQERTIIDAAREAGTFTTLLGALDQTGLTATLEGEGPFTVFAPTDEAFDLLPTDALAGLDADTLTRILTFHVVAGELAATDVAGSTSLDTVEGSPLSVGIFGAALLLDGLAQIRQTDVIADNGVIHVIDGVMLPPDVDFPGDLVDALSAYPVFSTLVSGLQAADLVDTLRTDNDGAGFTVFAPIDPAFDDLGVDLASLTTPQLSALLRNHVVGEEVAAADVVAMDAVPTLQPGQVSVDVIGDRVVLDDEADIIRADLRTSNGIIHVIDAVLTQ